MHNTSQVLFVLYMLSIYHGWHSFTIFSIFDISATRPDINLNEARTINWLRLVCLLQLHPALATVPHRCIAAAAAAIKICSKQAQFLCYLPCSLELVFIITIAVLTCPCYHRWHNSIFSVQYLNPCGRTNCLMLNWMKIALRFQYYCSWSF